MADGIFSYDTDIAPMQRNYFGDVPTPDVSSSYGPALARLARQPDIRSTRSSTTLNVGGGSGNFESFLRSAAPRAEFNYQRKIQSENLAYQNAMLEFEKRKMDLQQERDATMMTPKAMGELNSIFDSTPSGMDQLKKITEYEYNNPSLSQSETGKSILGLARDRAKLIIEAEREKRALDQQTRQERSTVVNALTPYNAEAANKVASGDLSLDEGRKLLEDQQTKEEKKNRKIVAEAKQEKLSDKVFEFQSDVIKGIESNWSSPSLERGVELDFGSITDDTDMVQAAELLRSQTKDTGKAFTPFQRQEFYENFSTLRGKPLDEVIKEYEGKDLELYRDLGKAIRENKTRLYRMLSGDTFGSGIPQTKPLEVQDQIDRGFRPE